VVSEARAVPHQTLRYLTCAIAVGSALIALVPPLGIWARTYDWAQALQFAVLAIATPAGVVVGSPWRLLSVGAWSRRLADARHRRPEVSRTVAFTGAQICVYVVWRTPGAVDWLVRTAWGGVAEAAVLIAVGAGFWLECVESPPLAPRATRLMRMVIAAVAMWTVWILAYLVGLSHSNWYHAFHHVAGRGISLAADQQLATGTLWFLATCAFVPVIFWNLVAWLKSEEDPDQELYKLTKQERRRGPFIPGQVQNRSQG
jgi:Cytochrome c oxidase caa3 assembly factor (Caa3_CtaG)